MKKLSLSSKRDPKLEVYTKLCKEHGLSYDVKKAKKFFQSCQLEESVLIDRMEQIIPVYKELAYKLGYTSRFVDPAILTDAGVWSHLKNTESIPELRRKTRVLQIRFDPALIGWALFAVQHNKIDEILEYISRDGEVILGTVLKAYEMLGRTPDGRIKKIIHSYR